MTFETLVYNIEENICTITINRPDKLNALNKMIFNELDQALDFIAEADEIKSVIITGAGTKAFVAGADISEFQSLDKTAAMQLSKKGQDVFFKIERSRKPIIAAVNGFALGGGCELAMACHFRICSENAKFGQPEINLGLIPGYGGTQRLTQLVGKGKSMELQLTAHLMDANEALQAGLVNYITTSESLLHRAVNILHIINNKAPLAAGKIIELVNAAANNREDGFAMEVEAFGYCFDTADRLEGTTAFLEKRKAKFIGK